MTYREVYTIRPNKKINGLHRVLSKFTEDRMHCTTQFITEIDMKDPESVNQLEKYVGKSGFASVDEWINCIPKRKLKMRLYYVRLCFL